MNTDEELRNAENLFIEGNICEAIPLLQQLANQGVGRAIYLCGICRDFGYLNNGELPGVEEALNATMISRRNGVEAGEILSRLALFKMFDWDRLTSQGIWGQMSTLDICTEERRQVHEAAAQLAKQGDVIAMWALGASQIYPVEDTKWMKKAAEAGFWMASEWMGNVYCSGSADKDDEKAGMYYEEAYESLQWYFQRAKPSDEETSNIYAAVERKCYSLCGELVKCFDRLGNFNEGWFWERKLSLSGSWEAWKTLGDIYNELEDEKLKERVSDSYASVGKDLYDHAKKEQKWDIMRRVIDHQLRQGKVSDVYSWVHIQGEMCRDSIGLWVLAKMLECHVDLKKNQLFLPSQLVHEKPAPTISGGSAISFYTRLYEEQSRYGENKALASAAALRIAFNYLGRDQKQVFSWAKKSAGYGNARNEKGLFLLGYCYRYGIGTNPDYNKARELFQKLEDMESEWVEPGRCYEMLGDLYSWTDYDKSRQAYELAMMEYEMGEAERKLECLHLAEQGKPLPAEDAFYFLNEDLPQ